MASTSTSTPTIEGVSRSSSPHRPPTNARRLSRGQQQYSDPQTYPYAFHPRDDSLRAHLSNLIFLTVFSPLIVLNWVRA